MNVLLSPSAKRCLDVAAIYLDDRAQARQQAAFQIAAEVFALADPSLSPEVRPVKMQWWEEELRRTATGSPRHPLTKALLPGPLHIEHLPLLRQWLVHARTRRQPGTESRTSFRIDAFRKFAVALLIATDDPLETTQRSKATDLGCALATLDALDRGIAAKDVAAEVASIRRPLSEVCGASLPVAWVALAATLEYSLGRLTEGKKVRSLPLVFRAWRAARAQTGENQ
ncbi:MAG: hypothetical protein AAFR91_13690 [Pseudomonadota bacterium]